MKLSFINKFFFIAIVAIALQIPSIAPSDAVPVDIGSYDDLKLHLEVIYVDNFVYYNEAGMTTKAVSFKPGEYRLTGDFTIDENTFINDFPNAKYDWGLIYVKGNFDLDGQNRTITLSGVNNGGNTVSYPLFSQFRTVRAGTPEAWTLFSVRNLKINYPNDCMGVTFAHKVNAMRENNIETTENIFSNISINVTGDVLPQKLFFSDGHFSGHTHLPYDAAYLSGPYCPPNPEYYSQTSNYFQGYFASGFVNNMTNAIFDNISIDISGNIGSDIEPAADDIFHHAMSTGLAFYGGDLYALSTEIRDPNNLNLDPSNPASFYKKPSFRNSSLRVGGNISSYGYEHASSLGAFYTNGLWFDNVSIDVTGKLKAYMSGNSIDPLPVAQNEIPTVGLSDVTISTVNSTINFGGYAVKGFNAPKGTKAFQITSLGNHNSLGYTSIFNNNTVNIGDVSADVLTVLQLYGLYADSWGATGLYDVV